MAARRQPDPPVPEGVAKKPRKVRTAVVREAKARLKDDERRTSEEEEAPVVEVAAVVEDEPEEAALADDDAPDALGLADTDGAETTAIVPASKSLPVPSPGGDLLQRYMADVARHPLLTREEELSLSREYVRTQDPKLAYRLVTANLRLVVKIAWEYRRAAFNMLDLVQEGNVGLMQGIRKYDPERGVKLSSYAAWWIRAYIIRYVMDNWRMVKLGTTQAQRRIFFNLRKEKEKLAREGFEPEAKLLAERMGVTTEEVEDMDRRLSGDDLSLDTPVTDEGGSTYADRLPGTGERVDDQLADDQIQQQFREKLAAFAAGLEGKEKVIFERRLVAEEPATLQEIGDQFRVSRERARQIEARLVQRLKDYMRAELPDFDAFSMDPPDE